MLTKIKNCGTKDAQLKDFRKESKTYMIKLIYLCFITSVTLGIIYQTHFDIEPTYKEFKKEYTAQLKELKEKEYQPILPPFQDGRGSKMRL